MKYYNNKVNNLNYNFGWLKKQNCMTISCYQV